MMWSLPTAALPPSFVQHEVQDTPAGAAKIRGFLLSNNNCTYAAAPTIFTFADRGGVSWQSSGKPEAPLAVGYAKIVPNSGNTSPSGLATFAIRQNGVLVSEAGVPASPLIQSGRIYAEINGSVNTGLAIANPNIQPATVSFYFTAVTVEVSTLSGSPTGLVGTIQMPANGQRAIFLNQISGLGSLPAPFRGVLRLSSSSQISVVGLRERLMNRAIF